MVIDRKKITEVNEENSIHVLFDDIQILISIYFLTDKNESERASTCAEHLMITRMIC